MPIVAFENRRTAILQVEIEPMGERHRVPHLATIGIRYTIAEGEEDRSTTVVGEDAIQFWCNAQCVGVDIVHPSPYQKLLWSSASGSAFAAAW